jgi:hypothetical protein
MDMVRLRVPDIGATVQDGMLTRREFARRQYRLVIQVGPSFWRKMVRRALPEFGKSTCWLE